MTTGAQEPGSRTSEVRTSYGPFSVVWPAQPQLANETPPQGGARASTYYVTLAPITFTLSYMRFTSPQMLVGQRDFARNMTSENPGAQILSTSAGQLKGFAVMKAVYRLGQKIVIAYSIQPTRTLNYVFTIGGPDGQELQARAWAFLNSFQKD
jgi:hypothetical protein